MPASNEIPGAAALPRRGFLYGAAGALAPLLAGHAFAQSAQPNRIELPPTAASTEVIDQIPGPGDAPENRVGFAIVGLGHLSLERILPAFGRTRHCRPVALVSGDRAKAQKAAAQYGIDADSIYDYAGFDRIAQNPKVQAVYVVLPNSMHAEYTMRAARAGKHVLCEKPMATSSADCRRMIDACNTAGVKLMIAYRSQYEPMSRAVVEMVKQGRLGTLKEFISTNSQNMGDPGQWRLHRALSGGGAMPDVGIYCLNAARFMSGEEPTEVVAWMHSPPGDPRFAEVEETMHFMLRFPSGFQATCHTSYGAHKSQMLRLLGSDAWVEMDPAYAYEGLRLRSSRVVDGQERVEQPGIGEKDQFALEMDHMALCLRTNREPLTGGAEGLQDMRITEAIYESARADGKAVKLQAPAGPTRGPDPEAPQS
jgi:predicted dehydrogenase